MYPVYVVDPQFVTPSRMCVNRCSFVLQSLADLDQSLRRLGSRLYVVLGSPEDVIPALAQRWHATVVTYERDTEPVYRQREDRVAAALQARGVRLSVHVSHTLHDVERYWDALNGKPAPINFSGATTFVLHAYQKPDHCVCSVCAPVSGCWHTTRAYATSSTHPRRCGCV